MGMLHGRLRPGRGRRSPPARADAAGVVVRAGGVGADRVPDGLLRAGRPGRAAAGAAAAGARRDGRGRHGGGAAGAAPGRGGVRDGEPRQVGARSQRMGLDEERIASSRTPEFGEQVPARRPAGRAWTSCWTAWRGELVDASLDLLPRGGRFIEMGKTDVRDAARGGGRARGRGLPGVRPDGSRATSASGRCSASCWSCSSAARWRRRRSGRGTCVARGRRSGS